VIIIPVKIVVTANSIASAITLDRYKVDTSKTTVGLRYTDWIIIHMLTCGRPRFMTSNWSRCLQSSGKSVATINSKVLSVKVLVGDGEQRSVGHVAVVTRALCRHLAFELLLRDGRLLVLV
jgi:hypothetical protein